jgi:excisionase family DNA binding protein
MPENSLLTSRQVAGILSVSRPTVYRLVAVGELPVVKIGAATRFRPRDVDALVERLADSGGGRPLGKRLRA